MIQALEVGEWEAEGGRVDDPETCGPVTGAPAAASGAPATGSPVGRDILGRLAHFAGAPLRHVAMPIKVGLAAGILMVVLGNLATVGMVVDGLQRLGSVGVPTTGAPVTRRIGWTVQGAIKAVVKGERLPFPPGDWYWNPSRVIEPAEGNEITEFPFFTFLYSDLHAHMMVMPVAFLALAWAVSLVLGRANGGQPRGSDPAGGRTPLSPAPYSLEEGGNKRKEGVNWMSMLGIGLSLFLGALASGAIYPMNLSDRYTYLALGVVAVAYATWRYADTGWFAARLGLPRISAQLLLTFGGVILFVALNVLLYKPYSDWYGQAYGAVDWWKGARTPIHSYLTHWGLFLFIIVSWLLWETRDWMANTPLSAARKLEPYLPWFFMAFLGLVFLASLQQAFVMNLLGKLSPKLVVYASWKHVSVVWLVIPLAAWAGTLILRPRQPEAKRVVLFLFGTGLVITLVVDTVVVRGDIGRMNTVFKFYLQVWALYAVCAAAALGWLWGALKDWLPSWRIPWKIFLAGLFISAGLYTVIAGRDKITDRMTPSAPRSLDSMQFMQYSTYDQPLPNQPSAILDISRDYRAIRWMQDNLPGSPVIMEANLGDNYRWYNRFSMYTGLPSVLGYEWHQIQQRTLLGSDWVHRRLTDIINFYLTSDPSEALETLRRYNVRYIIFGELEQAAYPGPGLLKFSAEDGRLWRQIYPPAGVDPQNETIIYEVIAP